MSLRCFIAVNIPPDIRAAVGEAIETLRSTGADVKWVHADNLHITLKFLGSTEDSLVGPIRDSLQKKIASSTPFYIKISGIGTFPSGRNPRVVWIGVEDRGNLTGLQEVIEGVAAEFGFPPEARPYSPHLTIGRVRSNRKAAGLLESVKGLQGRDFGGFDVRRVALVKSVLKPLGPEYSSLAEISLEGRGDVEQG